MVISNFIFQKEKKYIGKSFTVDEGRLGTIFFIKGLQILEAVQVTGKVMRSPYWSRQRSLFNMQQWLWLLSSPPHFQPASARQFPELSLKHRDPTLCYYSCINYFTVQRHYLWFLSVNILPVQQNLRISPNGRSKALVNVWKLRTREYFKWNFKAISGLRCLRINWSETTKLHTWDPQWSWFRQCWVFCNQPDTQFRFYRAPWESWSQMTWCGGRRAVTLSYWAWIQWGHVKWLAAGNV